MDGHTHFATVGAQPKEGAARGGEDTRSRHRVGSRRAPVQGWVIGQGWDATGWRRAPERFALDAVQRSPVYLDSLDVHAAWVNSAALAAAGITRDTADPFGGRIVRDAAGEPTGLLLERAVELIFLICPFPHPSSWTRRYATRRPRRTGWE